MSCRVCRSSSQKSFDSEINLHSQRLADLNKMPCVVFPTVLVCLDCGFIEGQLSNGDLGTN
jgi:hypothetical protein